MYGGRNKRLNRLPPHRNSSGPRTKPGWGIAAPLGTGRDEAFSLVRCDEPVAFGMVVKLTADLAETIKKVGASGGSMRVKFDSLNNSSSNVIDVDGKEFNFNWFRDKCDIYEERQNGDDGNGLLVDYGCSWRKLNVQRILDEATKQQYKKRSEEAERMQKASKVIVLDHESPSMKSQIKQLVAVEANPRMHFRNKKEHPTKKRRADPPPVGSVPKSVFRSGSSKKIRHSTPPAPSPPKQSFTGPSPPGIVNMNNSPATNKDFLPTETMSEDAVASFEKKISHKVTNAVQESAGHKVTVGTKPEDIQSILISLLMKNPKGMSLKALVKAVGNKISNSAKKIEPIIKKIATLQAPGKYILKQGVGLVSFKKPLPEGGSSPKYSRHFSTGNKETRDQHVQESSTTNRGPINEGETHAELNPKGGDEPVDIVDIVEHTPDILGVKKDSCISNGRGGSNTDSDTDSESSGSGSDSGSPSRSWSKSPAESGSKSSSDSDSNVSSNSKDGSDADVHVDIIGDDDKGPEHNLKSSELTFSSSPVSWRSDEQPVQNRLAGNKLDGNECDGVEIEEDMPDHDQEPGLNVVNDKLPECREYIGKLFDKGDDAGDDSLRNDHSESSKRTTRGKSKRCDNNHFNGEPKHVKRLREENLAQLSILNGKDEPVSGSPHSSNYIRSYDLYRGLNSQPSSRADMELNAHEVHPKCSSDSQGRKSSNQSWQAKSAEAEQFRTEKCVETAGPGHKYPGKGSYGHYGIPTQNNIIQRDTLYEPSYVNEKRVPRHTKEASDGGRNPIPLNYHYRKNDESAGKFKDAGQFPSSSIRSSPKENFGDGADRSPVVDPLLLMKE